ncbi:unnamed protein product [Cylicostephanus goldi]|uniref:Carbonic anhydrase n=1 Tax=Cylicostephanus goldi TaxID=71465 RepID=A0A3P7M5N3_CYLGO|nr:unnamed protein product [Cylicostephanus goldi]
MAFACLFDIVICLYQVKQFVNIRDTHAHPGAVFFSCMDARMFPARITSTTVGDMYVVRNPGSMIPRAENYGSCGCETSLSTEAAGLELTVKRGGIKHVIICGHSNCKAMNTLYNLHKNPKKFDANSPLDLWIREHGFLSLKKLEERLASKTAKPLKYSTPDGAFSFEAIIDEENKFDVEDKLSQINTLQQMENCASHGFLADILANKAADLHAMWFDIFAGETYLFSRPRRKFILIDEKTVDSLQEEVKQHVA